MIHDFKESLARSHDAEDLPIWEHVYKTAFPGMIEMVSYRSDGFWQREGVDRGVLLETTKQILIDEKVRYRNSSTGKVYDDILLEYWSSFEHKTKGWVCKNLRCDYIAYLIAPLGICYMLPTIQLQNSWSKYGEEWKKDYFNPKAKNKGYTTYSVAVPANVVFKALGQELRINFNPFEN